MKTLIITIAMLLVAANLSAGEPLDTLWTMKTNLFGYAGAKFVHNDTKILLAYGGKFYEIDALTGDTLRMSENFIETHSIECTNNPNLFLGSIKDFGLSVFNYQTFKRIGSLSGGGSAISINHNESMAVSYKSYKINEEIPELRGILVFDLNTLDSIKFIESKIGQYGAGVTKLKFTNDGRFLVAVLRNYEDNQFAVVRVFDGNTFDFIKDIFVEQRELNNPELSFSQDGSLLCIKLFFDKLYIFDTQTWEKKIEINKSQISESEIFRGIISQDNKRVFVIATNSTSIWNIVDDKLIKKIPDLLSLAFSISNKLVLGYRINFGPYVFNSDFILSSIYNSLPQTFSLYYNNGFTLSTTQEINFPPMIEVFNLNGTTILSLSPMIPLGGIYKNNTPIPNGLYFVKLHINGQVYTTNIIVE